MTLLRQVIPPEGPAIDRSGKFTLPLSPAVRGGDFVFVSGMAAIDPATGERAHATVGAETRQILANMGKLLEAAGSSLGKIVKANVLIHSMLEYDNMNSVYREFFPADPPARTVCGVKLIGGHKVEIDSIALAGAAGPGRTTDLLHRGVIEPANPKLNVSRNARLPHSPGITAGDYIFLSGMGPVDPATGGRNLGPIAEQIRQTLRNMAHMLESAGSGLDRIVKMTVVLADAADYEEMNRVWCEFFPAEPPARTTCALQLSNGNGVEIECIALAGKSPS
jgi:2-iminobutanoate/2-iminopropanoate deaminase